MTLACIGLGSNLGDSLATLRGAVQALRQHPDIRIDRCSACYRSKPWGVKNQAEFLNAVVGVHTELEPEVLLGALQTIENRFGRLRAEKWGPRTLDLDILCHGELQRQTASLQLPHPYFAQRDFVLEPLAEIYPDLCIDGQSASDWLARYRAEHPDAVLPVKLEEPLL